MNSRFLITLIIALVLASGAAWLAKKWVDAQTGKSLKAQESMTPVVMAAIDIPYGTKIDSSHVKMFEWPKDALPAGVFTTLDQVKGKIVQRSFVANEVLLEPQVKDHLAGTILSSMITEGMRAVSVRVDDVAGVAGFIAPGNKVDIISTDKGFAYTLLSNIKVLAIDQTSSQEQDKPAVVRALTLEVTPKDSKTLVKAMRTGPLQFTLRNPLDDETLASELIETPTKTIEVVEVLDKVEENVPPVKTKPVHYVNKPVARSFKVIPWNSNQETVKQIISN